MKKIITVEHEIEICDFCGKEVDSFQYTCECKICGRNICLNCRELIKIGYHTEVYLCPDCKGIDISDYIKNRNELDNLYRREDELIEEGFDIIEKIKERYYATI